MNPLRHLDCLALQAPRDSDTDCVVDVRGLQQPRREDGPARHVEIHFTSPKPGHPEWPLVVLAHEDVPVYLAGDEVDGVIVKTRADGSISDIVALGRAPQLHAGLQV